MSSGLTYGMVASEYDVAAMAMVCKEINTFLEEISSEETESKQSPQDVELKAVVTQVMDESIKPFFAKLREIESKLEKKEVEPSTELSVEDAMAVAQGTVFYYAFPALSEARDLLIQSLVAERELAKV